MKLEEYKAKMRHWNDSRAILDCAKEDGIAIGEDRGREKGWAERGDEDRSYIKSLQAQGFSSDEILEKFMQKS